MALRKDWPAIRAEWLWWWINQHTVAVRPLIDPRTRVLIVHQNARPQKTWRRQGGGKIATHTTRYWLGEGVILVPRWDPLELHFDPKIDTEVEQLSDEELRNRGMLRLEDGNIIILIYMHVEGALHFQRQQLHIRLESYTDELRRIETVLEVLEREALNLIGESAEEAEAQPGNLTALRCEHRQRREDIAAILTHLAPRERAAGILVNSLRRETKRVQRGIQGAMRSTPMQKLLRREPVKTEGLRQYLAGLHHDLDQMGVRPVVQPLGRAQARLRAALGNIDVRQGEGARHQLKLALGHLAEALTTLKHPKENF